MSALSISVVCRGTDWPTAPQHRLKNAQFLSPDALSNSPLAISLPSIEGPVGSAGNPQSRTLFAVPVASVPVDFLSCFLLSVFLSCRAFSPVHTAMAFSPVHTAVHLLCLTVQFWRRTIANDEPRIANRYCVSVGGGVGGGEMGIELYTRGGTAL